MKKFAFLGAVSAIALMCTPVLADPPHPYGGSGLSVDENQVPVVTGDNSAAAATKDSLNGNNVLSNNTDNSDNSQDDSVDVTANNNQLLSNNTDNSQLLSNNTDNSTNSKVFTNTKTETKNELEIEDNQLFSNNTTNSYNNLTDQSTNVDVKFDDVMANVNVTSANVGGVAAQAFSSESSGYPVLATQREGRGGPGGYGGYGKDCCAGTSASTGNIGGVTIQSTRGITAANLNTGVASQANNISLNAQVNNAQ